MYKKEKIKNWLKNKNNLIFLAISLISLILGFYYFFLTKNQPIWWDESDYLAYAKNLAGLGGDWIITAKHNSLFPFLVAALFKMGFSESLTKLFLELIPYFLIVFLTYLIAKEMYQDRKIALISMFLMATTWAILFNAMRFHLGIPATVFGLTAIYIFWKGYEKKEKIFGKIPPNWAIPLTGIFIILTYSIRRGFFLFGFFLLVYILLTKNWKDILKDKSVWLGGIISLILLTLVEKTIFTSGVNELAGGYAHTENPINLLPLEIFSSYFSYLGGGLNILLWLFWIGLFLVMGKVFLSIGLIKTKKNYETRADLFNFIVIIITLLFFILILRSQNSFGEPRWYFPLLFSSLICISRASVFLSNFLKNYGKNLSVVFLILVIVFGGYYQVKHADFIINAKIDTYSGVKEAGLFLKETTLDKNALVIVAPQPQMAYYSELAVKHPKRFSGWNGTKEETPLEDFMHALNETFRAKYIVVTFSEPGHPSWMAKTTHTRDNSGQIYRIWEIPFMDTKINFGTGEQNIRKSMSYGDITFKLLTIKQDAFVYGISRT